MAENKPPPKPEEAEPPGEGDSIADASREALERIERHGNDHAGRGDGG